MPSAQITSTRTRRYPYQNTRMDNHTCTDTHIYMTVTRYLHTHVSIYEHMHKPLHYHLPQARDHKHIVVCSQPFSMHTAR